MASSPFLPHWATNSFAAYPATTPPPRTTIGKDFMDLDWILRWIERRPFGALPTAGMEFATKGMIGPEGRYLFMAAMSFMCSWTTGIVLSTKFLISVSFVAEDSVLKALASILWSLTMQAI